MANIDLQRDARMVTEFTIPGIPWVTSSLASAQKHHLFTDSTGASFFAQWVTVKNTGLSGSLSVAFTSTGISTNNYFTVAAGQSFEKPLAVYQIYVSGVASQPYTVIAGLTGINSNTIPNYLSSSAGFTNC